MKVKTINKRTANVLRKCWQIAMILLLNIALLTAAVSPIFLENDNNSIMTLSKLGSRGDEVRKIQNKLKQLGYSVGNVDGIYGNNTRNAVIKFQKNCGITADGIAGPKTLLYLGLGGSGNSGGSGGSSNSGSSGKYSSSDIALLAKMISAESRGEPYEGQVAVGAVILNRVQHASFPDTIPGVIYQPGAFSALHDMNWSQPVAESSKKAAQDAINGWDPSGGAIYYYDPSRTSNKFMFSRPIIKTIGVHRFCS